MKSISRTPLLAALLLANVLPSPARAQDEERRNAIVRAVGEQPADTLFTVHEAVNALAKGWAGETFEADRAAELASSYQESAELALKLVRTAPASAEAEQIAAAGESLVKQAAALEAWIKLGEDSLGQTYRKHRARTDALLLGTDPLAAAPDAPGIELDIVKAVAPGQQPGQLGTMRVTRAGEKEPLLVEWEYENGTGDKGFGIPFPGSGRLAASFGDGVQSLHLYKRDENNRIDGLWVPLGNSGGDGKEITAIQFNPGDKRLVYEFGDTRFTVELFEDAIANVTWHFDTGDVPGIAVLGGDYLAAIAITPGQQGGIALYDMADDLATAHSRWVAVGADSAGAEELTVTRIDEGFFPPIPATDAPAAMPPTADSPATASASPDAAGPESEVRKIAEALSADLGRAKQWKPGAEALAAIAAAPEEAEALAAYADTVFGQIPSGQPGSKPGQTEILVRGPGLEELPGGYSQNIGHFKPGVKFYGFKYVEPGETLGMAYDGIFQVEGKWYFLPKAWRAFDAVRKPE